MTSTAKKARLHRLYRQGTSRSPSSAARKSRLAETEMPGLMANARGIRPQAAPEGARRIAGSLHMTIQTAVLDRDAGGAWRRQSAGSPATSIRRRTTPRPRSAAAGIPVFALKGESLKEYWDYNRKIVRLAWRRYAPT